MLHCYVELKFVYDIGSLAHCTAYTAGGTFYVKLGVTADKVKAWSSLVEGGEGSYLPNCQTILVIVLDALFLFFCIFINTTTYHLGRYKPSPPST